MELWVYIVLYLWIGLCLGVIMAYGSEDAGIGMVTCLVWPIWGIMFPLIGVAIFFEWIADTKHRKGK